MGSSIVGLSTGSKAEFGEASANWVWLLVLGMLFIVLGMIGLGRLFLFSIAGTVFFGILIIIGGAAQFLEAIKCKGWKGIAFHILISILYILGGIFILLEPVAASLVFSWVLAGVFIGVGVLRIVMALRMRATGGWLVPLLGGIVSVVLGAMIYAKWPVSGLYIIGMFIAIELIVNGWSYIFIALTARRIGKTVKV